MKITTTILVGLLFLLVWFAFNRLQIPSSQEMPEQSAEEKEIIPDLISLSDQDVVTWLQVQNLEKKQVVTLVREGESWNLKFPVHYPANTQMVESFLQELMNTKKEQQFLPEKNWEEYGLLKPEIKIGIETENFPERRYLYLGDKSPVDRKIFARWEGEKGYFLLSPEIKETFEKTVYSLREKRLLRNSGQIVKLLIRHQEQTYQWNMEGGNWVWQYPEHIRGQIVSEGVIKEMNLFLKDLHIKEFLDDAPKNQNFGFSEYSNYIRVDYDSGESEALFIGEEFSQRDAFYAKLSDEKTVLLVSREHLRHLFESARLLAEESSQPALTTE